MGKKQTSQIPNILLSVKDASVAISVSSKVVRLLIVQFCIKAIQDFAYSGFGGRGGKHGDIFWDNESYAIKHYLKMFAELASATLKQVADWFVWLAGTLGRFNANELRRADHKVHDIADGRYDGRIQKFQQGLSR